MCIAYFIVCVVIWFCFILAHTTKYYWLHPSVLYLGLCNFEYGVCESTCEKRASHVQYCLIACWSSWVVVVFFFCGFHCSSLLLCLAHRAPFTRDGRRLVYGIHRNFKSSWKRCLLEAWHDGCARFQRFQSWNLADPAAVRVSSLGVRSAFCKQE